MRSACESKDYLRGEKEEEVYFTVVPWREQILPSTAQSVALELPYMHIASPRHDQFPIDCSYDEIHFSRSGLIFFMIISICKSISRAKISMKFVVAGLVWQKNGKVAADGPDNMTDGCMRMQSLHRAGSVSVAGRL